MLVTYALGSDIFMLIASIIGFVYVYSLFNLYIGNNTNKHRMIVLAINFALLIIFIIGLITAIGSLSGGASIAIFIILALIMLTVIVLGIIGGFTFNAELHVSRIEKFRKQLHIVSKTFIYSSIAITIMTIVIIGLRLSRMYF